MSLWTDRPGRRRQSKAEKRRLVEEQKRRLLDELYRSVTV